MKSQGKLGIVKECFIILSRSENIRENKLFSPDIIFINFSVAVCKVDVPFVSVNVNSITLHSAIVSICTLPIY